MKLPTILERYRSEIDAELLKPPLVDHPLPLYHMMRYHLGWVDADGNSLHRSAGKALRPALCLFACDAIDSDYRKAKPAAAALELLHNFSLIHDDIQDNDTERRHRPTVWSVWGQAQAINAGTAMWTIANLALFHLADFGVSVPTQLKAQRLLNEACLTLLEGQYIDISYEDRLDIGVSDYLQMIDKKTASLIARSLEMGALLGTDEEPVIQNFQKLGRSLGLAFQIRDDVLGIWGDETETGKPKGSDIRRKKKSFPIVYALERAEGQAKIDLTKIYNGDGINEDGHDRVLGILDDFQAEDYSQSIVEQYCERALTIAESIRLPAWAHDSLVEIAHFLTQRNF
jgi:geranylgeranyl diphosphate synthase, type I